MILKDLMNVIKKVKKKDKLTTDQNDDINSQICKSGAHLLHLLIKRND